MKPLRILVVALCLSATTSASAAETVDLDYRLRADRDLTVDQVQENVTAIRVIEDRGLVAKAASNGSRFPGTYHVVNRQRFRYTTGAAQPDGSFPATLSILSRRVNLRLASGEEQPAIGQPDMDNFVFKAVIDPQGRVLQPSVEAGGVDAGNQEAIKAVMTSVLEQATRIEPLRVEQGQAAQQVVNMKLPLPGLTELDLRITASNRLIAITDGVAKVEMVYVMEFGIPQGPVRLTASGTGGGTLLYDIAGRMARSIESNTLMTIVAEVPDGTLEFQMNTRQTQQMQDAVR
jgi:hypothetical protein